MEPRLFAGELLRWHENNPRPMPWLEAKDPYKIWISEIILQQTRVKQGWHYYIRFLEKFPDVFALHVADESEVLKAWEGLGYYTRARNLKKTASVIVEKHGGQFPDNYDTLLSLPGIGLYTAAAIAGFAFDLPHPVIDGNVTRLICRLFGIEKPARSPEVTKKLHEFVHQAIRHSKPSLFNQAIMNFGALVCKPASPDCHSCPFSPDCTALQENTVNIIPVRLPKQEKKSRYFHYFVFHDRQTGKTAVTPRNHTDIWKGLFEFPLIENGNQKKLEPDQIAEILAEWNYPDSFEWTGYSLKKQELSHQKITFHFYFIEISSQNISAGTSITWINPSDADQFAMPVTLKNVVNRYVVSKNLY